MRPTPPSTFGLATFRFSFRQMIPSKTLRSLTARFHSGQGAPPPLPAPDLIETLVYHPLQSEGTLAEHLVELGLPPRRDASLAERRQHLDPRLFEQILATVLRPLADPGCTEAFYLGCACSALMARSSRCATPRRSARTPPRRARAEPRRLRQARAVCDRGTGAA
jgi:hypothetical protein